MKVHLKLFVAISFAAFLTSQDLRADVSTSSPTVPDADNTRMNQQSQTTADQASNAKSDTELMRDIRRALVEDKSLSTYAHNVKIIAKEGKVVLKGTVHSEDEKSAIGAKASALAGENNVTNHITVKGS